MIDSLQHSLHAAAAAHPTLGTLAVLLANDLIVLLALLFLVMVWMNRQRMTWGQWPVSCCPGDCRCCWSLCWGG